MSAQRTLSSDDLAGTVTGIRWCDVSGLLCVRIEQERGPRRLGIGVGPLAIGLGLLPAAPRFAAAPAHPLVMGLRAHLVGKAIQIAELGAGHVSLVVAGDEGEPEPAVELHAELVKAGRITLIAKGRIIAEWPPGRDPWSGPADRDAARVATVDLGRELLATSDREAESAAWRGLQRAVRRKHKSLERRRSAVQSDIDRAEDIPELERAGHLLLAHGADVPRGAREAVLVDWETGQPVHIPLDPAKPARAQAAALFARARRLKRGLTTMHDRMKTTEQARSDLVALDERIRRREGGQDPEGEIAQLWALATALGVRPSGAKSSPVAPKAPERLPYARYEGAGGRAILVGRGARDNDALTLEHARPGDLFLHVRGATGAHVIVPKPKGQACPSELLVDAATLAAHFSDARGEAAQDVSYVERRYVHKPRKSPAGAVVLDRQKVLRLRLDPKRLARLLASKKC